MKHDREAYEKFFYAAFGRQLKYWHRGRLRRS